MNKALIAAAGFVTAVTVVSVRMVGDPNLCRNINGWTAPVTILLTVLITAVLAYHAGRSKRVKAALRAVCLKRIGVPS